MRIAAILAAMAALAGCGSGGEGTEIVVQRFFGECGAVYGQTVDVSAAEGECGILTTLINKFEAENPDIRLKINVVAWPGYPQLSAQIAAGDPPDVVIMHQSVISDYQGRGLLEPMDELLREAGIGPETFTEAGRAGAIKSGRTYALPWDTIGRLWHINTALMRQAGLMDGDRPILPASPEQLLEHARRFKQATGKPYLIQAQVSAPDYYVANLYTYLLAQGAEIFPDSRHIRLNTPEAHRIVQLFKTLNADGGIFPTGTWMIGPYDDEAKIEGRPLHGNYAVMPFPRLWGEEAAFVDGHAWVMPRAERTARERQAIGRFLSFLAAHNFDWSRTGHLPAFQAVLATPQFRALPHRSDIAAMAATGAQLPEHAQRQSAIQGLIGEELEAAVAGTKPIDQALADAERRVNELLAYMPET